VGAEHAEQWADYDRFAEWKLGDTAKLAPGRSASSEGRRVAERKEFSGQYGRPAGSDGNAIDAKRGDKSEGRYSGDWDANWTKGLGYGHSEE